MWTRTSLKHPLFVWLLVLGVSVLDFFTGPQIIFPILDILPVTLAAWNRRRILAVTASLFLTGIHVWFGRLWSDSENDFISEIINAMIQCFMLVAIAFLVSRHRKMMTAIRVLHGMLPICCFCNKIRDESGNWQRMELYIGGHSEATFTHTFCPTCFQKNYGDHLKPASSPSQPLPVSEVRETCKPPA